MSRIQSFLVLVVCLSVCIGAAVQAATVTVTTTINAALESLDYNDGEDDVVIVPPGVYTEQVFPKGNAGVDSTAFPLAAGITVQGVRDAIASHPDALTIQAQDPNNPPIITRAATTTINLYGMFPSNPGDFFEATLVVGARDVTLSGLNIQYGPGGGYAMNGMGTNYTFQDCLFTYGATSRNEDFCDWNNNYQNNSDVDPQIGLDNTFVFDGCIIDGSSTVDGTLFDSSFIWWHGYDDVAKNEVSFETFTGCIFRYWDDELHEWRGRSLQGSGFAGTIVTGCFSRDAGDHFQWRGNQGRAILTGNVFLGNGGFFARVRDRDGGQIREIQITNNIFDGGGNANRVLRLQSNGTVNGWNAKVVNNTFWHYGTAVDQEAGTNASCSLFVANNLFYATDTGTIGVGVNIAGDATVDLLANLFVNNATNVVGTPDSESGTLSATDPVVNNLTLTVPDTPGPATQGFVPQAGSPALDAGDTGAAALVNLIGDDVDGDPRLVGPVDIGAQESPAGAAPQQSGVDNWNLLDWNKY